MVHSAPPGKAPGADGWTIEEFRRLPFPAWLQAEQLLELVERKGAWPRKLRTIIYVMIPKPGAREAGERRPIALLPMLYRV